MPIVTLTFTNPINVSLQSKPAGDNQASDDVYFTRIVNNAQSGEVLFMGSCTSISTNNLAIGVTTASNIPLPAPGDFIFFSKDSSVNTPGLLGSYAEVEMTNDSTEYAELFSINSDISESSK